MKIEKNLGYKNLWKEAQVKLQFANERIKQLEAKINELEREQEKLIEQLRQKKIISIP